MNEAAKDLRKEVMRDLLLPYMPTMILNDWVGEPVRPGFKMTGQVKTPLESMHPSVAEGIVNWLDDKNRRTPRPLVLKLMPYFTVLCKRAVA